MNKNIAILISLIIISIIGVFIYVQALDSRGVANVVVPATSPDQQTPIAYEVINGVTVPPEPDPELNNATIAGIDVNGNGVRDDVERVIARKSTGINDFNNAMAIAYAYQAILVAPNLNTDQYYAEIVKVTCADLEARGELSSTQIRPMIFDSSTRKDEFIKKTADIKGRSIFPSEVCANADEFVINGIAVPPEPDPELNNATLAGIDVNGNGIRDDVERVIAEEFGNDKDKHSKASDFAKAEQAVIVLQTQEATDSYMKHVDCTPLTDKELDPSTELLLNTPDRRRTFALNMAGATGVIGRNCE
jgi:hypothetical protein